MVVQLTARPGPASPVFGSLFSSGSAKATCCCRSDQGPVQIRLVSCNTGIAAMTRVTLGAAAGADLVEVGWGTGVAVALGVAPALGVAVALNVLRVACGTGVAWGTGVATACGVAVAVDPQATATTKTRVNANQRRT